MCRQIRAIRRSTFIALALLFAFHCGKNPRFHPCIEEAERDRPTIVLLSEQKQLAESAPMIMEYLRMHYLLTDQVGDIAIYERIETP